MSCSLLYMPFGGVDRLPLGLSNLKAALAARGLSCDVRYLNFDFAQRVGSRRHRTRPDGYAVDKWFFSVSGGGVNLALARA
jgi:hypothetical protein